MKKIYVLPGIALAALIGLAASFPDSPKLHRSKKKPSLIRHVASESNELEPGEPRPLTVAQTARRVEEVARPPQASEDVDSLHAWLLGLSGRELSNLLGTSELDRYVERVIVGLERTQPDPSQPSLKVDLFLAMLNKRLEAVQP